MSKGRFTSRREAAIKQIKAKAHKEQTTFRTAVDEFSWKDTKRLGLYKGLTPLACITMPESKPSAASSRTTQPATLDTGCDVCDDHLSSFALPSRLNEPIKVSLNDVKTKRAKAKGVRKEYEVIQSASQRVIVLDDFEDSSSDNNDDDDDWEQVDRVDPATSRRNYANVVKGS
ncbi:hypothetical protein BKA70DRAFT_1315485 [Coprinopsis sp. MPI-PUGE-AT-0042]|nr:hypothetical protein BKA70DRAFT_1315485 [Coprinopsis sp. MPI-PUGE-AT-0042]